MREPQDLVYPALRRVPNPIVGAVSGRVAVDGKHLALVGRPFRVRGVTYGGFRPRADGAEFPDPDRIERDFAAMAAAGINVVRTYTLPPADLLDRAHDAGLRVLVGLHYADWRLAGAPGRATRRRVLDAGRAAVAEAAGRCAGRDAVLAIAVGNEVPGDLVRLHGIRSVEETLAALIDDVHDAGMLATYCNYPTTEYLDVGGQDLVCFNVFLEDAASFRSYLRHLQVVAGDAPLVITELGLAGAIHGEQAQADLLAEQLRAADETGCAGATVFAWTDEWFVGGYPVEGWGFGITSESRAPKPAHGVVEAWARRRTKDLRERWPRVSAIVCAYNEERHLLECLRSLEACDYPNLEVIVCDDGSTDRTLDIARRFPFTVLDLPHAGLSVARNAGLAAATGEIVAYLDADAACHREWPYHLAFAFEDPAVGAAGGPNLPVPNAGFVERAVGHAPGGPIHVLLSDDRAEHVPGCNMAFRRDVLESIGGFDPIFSAAGDDVDVCWRVLDAGHAIAYAPAAQVLHHRRGTVRGYLRQQRTYGRAERVVSGKHPHRCKRSGTARWSGSIYGGPRVLPSLLRPVVYHGHFGLAPFQGVLRRRSAGALGWASALLPLTAPLLLLAGLTPLSRWWLVPAAAGAAFLAAYGAAIALAVRPGAGERHPAWFRALVGALHAGQPLARTWGRLRGRPARHAAPPLSPVADRAGWIENLRRELARRRCATRSGDPLAAWDLEVRAGPFLAARLTLALAWGETHRWRTRFRPRLSIATFVAASAALGAAVPRAGGALAALAAAAVLVEASILRRRLAGAVAVTTQPEAARPAPVAAAPVRREKAQRPKRPRTPRPARPRGLGRRILHEGRPFRARLVLLFAVGLFETPMLLLSPIPLKLAVDSVLGAHPVPGFLDAVLPAAATGSGFRILIVAAVLQILIVFLINLQQLGKDLLGAQVGEGMTLRFRAKLFAQLQRLSLAFHDRRSSADALYRIQYDASAIKEYLVLGILPTMAAAVALGSMIYVTARLDWQLALVALGVSPFLFLLARVYKRSLRARHRHTKEVESSALGVVQEVLGGLRLVKAFGREDVEQDRFEGRAHQGMRARVRLVLAQGALGLLVGVVTAVGTAAVLFIGVRNVEAGVLTVGELLVILAYLSQLYSPLKTISKNVVQLQSALAGAERAFDLLDGTPDVVDPPDARRIDRATGTIELRGVSFSYADGERVLRDVSLEIEAGTRLGVVGATGAGKTTLVSLLMRFYEPGDGQILVDGVDIRDVAVADLRRQFALVLQDPLLFSATVRENIAYGRPGASDEEIVEAATLARAHEFVARLPYGYDTMVGERGMLLSGGERQRIALARAFLRDAPILILDEPTSAVDSDTERLIVDALDELMRGRTTIVISHRPSALRRCTRLVRLEDARVSPVDPPDAGGEDRKPLLEEKPVGFVRSTAGLAEHEAVRAFLAAIPDAREPAFVDRLGMGTRKRRSEIYRLGGAGPEGEHVIAKSERPAVVETERLLYEEILPSLGMPALRCYGALAADGLSWLFLEDAGGEPFSESDPVHRAAAAEWMAAMHVASSRRGELGSRLPPQGPARYLEHLRRGRSTILENLGNREIRHADAEILNAALRRLDELEASWDELAGFCDAVPQCLVHGDFVAKNAHVRRQDGASQLLLLDWQTAGWGTPAPDVMRLDPVLYRRAVAEAWPHLELEDVDELRRIGTIFRAIAAIDWEARMLAHPWVDGALRNIQAYEGWLYLAGRGLPYRMGSVSL